MVSLHILLRVATFLIALERAICHAKPFVSHIYRTIINAHFVVPFVVTLFITSDELQAFFLSPFSATDLIAIQKYATSQKSCAAYADAHHCGL
ncbi:hypothetical protein OUZ56_004975 [Daphnia magna]|uniref:Secreted protein n=1 Tax=Daphnia magna TaxID=35525 RepID=A0ABQ9YRE4_9CRUS|nr:hypothetical protein OUZ56_004975 [Daphnia magna]